MPRGEARNMILKVKMYETLTVRRQKLAPKGCICASLEKQGFRVKSLPLGKYNTDHGLIKVVNSVHKEIDSYFYIETTSSTLPTTLDNELPVFTLLD